VQLLNHCRKRRVSAAARSARPGNSIPKFKNNEEEIAKLDELVKKLLPDCSLPYFGEKAIRKHIKAKEEAGH